MFKFLKELLQLREMAENHFNDASFDPNSPLTAEVARFAAEQQRLDVLARVFADGFNPSHVYEDDTNLMHYALSPEVVRFMLCHGIAVDKRDKLGRTPLHQVPHLNHPQALLIAELLLQAGASPHMPDNEGSSPLDLAEISANLGGEASIYQVLRRHSDDQMRRKGVKGCVIIAVLILIALYFIFNLFR